MKTYRFKGKKRWELFAISGVGFITLVVTILLAFQFPQSLEEFFWWFIGALGISVFCMVDGCYIFWQLMLTVDDVKVSFHTVNGTISAKWQDIRYITPLPIKGREQLAFYAEITEVSGTKAFLKYYQEKPERYKFIPIEPFILDYQTELAEYLKKYTIGRRAETGI